MPADVTADDDKRQVCFLLCAGLHVHARACLPACTFAHRSSRL